MITLQNIICQWQSQKVCLGVFQVKQKLLTSQNLSLWLQIHVLWTSQRVSICLSRFEFVDYVDSLDINEPNLRHDYATWCSWCSWNRSSVVSLYRYKKWCAANAVIHTIKICNDAIPFILPKVSTKSLNMSLFGI